MHSYFKVVGKLSFLCSVSVDGVIVGLIPGCRCNETKVVKIAAKPKAVNFSLKLSSNFDYLGFIASASRD